MDILGPERVNITPLKTTDISGEAVTGGYLFELNERLDEDVNWRTSRGTPYSLKEPTSPVREQIDDLKNYVQMTEEILYSNNFADPVGANGSGQLGIGNLTSRSSPVQVGALTDWTQISGGHGGHSMAIRSNGTLWAWGYGASYQITTTGGNRSSPIQIGTGTNWKQVGAGGYFTAALKTDGTIWAWGANNYGSNGVGTGTSQSSPMQVGALTDWAKLSVGYEHCLAIKTDGTLWSWGNNGNGQLGIGTTVSKSSPVQVGSLTTWKEITAGLYHCLAIRNDGTMWGWGENYAGHAAGAAIGTVSSPVQVGTLTTWSQVSAGYSQTFALKTDGTLWAWGDGTSPAGGLGLGNTSMTYSPKQVGTLTTWVHLGTGSRKMYIRSS